MSGALSVQITFLYQEILLFSLKTAILWIEDLYFSRKQQFEVRP